MSRIITPRRDLILPSRYKQRGFIINPYRFASGGGGGGDSDPHWANVVSLLHFDGADGSTTIVEESGRATWPGLGGDAQLDTANKKFGASSLLLDGSGDFVQSDTDADLGFATGAFTIEGFFKRNGLGTDQGLYMRGLLSGGLDQASLAHAIYFGADNKLNFRAYNGGSNVTVTASSAVTDTEDFHHFAMSCDGSTLYGFFDGGLVGSVGYTSQNEGSGWRSVIGSFGGNWGLYYSGWIDEVRVTKGVARYTETFTPPTAPFPDS